MDVSVIGASGDCGREIVSQLVALGALAPTERLQLVGRPQGRSARVLYGLCSDLNDAYAEMAPMLDVALAPEAIVADVIVMAAGATVAGEITSRADLAAVNLPLFETYAQAIARYGGGHEIVIIVTNPVELAVEVFSRQLGRHRVIGVGAYSDSLRFRREIAADLGVRRQLVQGFIVGEHGEGMVPLWSSVQVHGMTLEEVRDARRRLQRDRIVSDFPKEVSQEKQAVLAYLKAGDIPQAYRYVDSLPPDLRVVVKPFVTHISGAKTITATANVTVDLVQNLLQGREIVVSGQVQLDGEFYGVRTPFGVPIVVTPFGWTQVVPLELWAEEADLLHRMANQLSHRLQEDLHRG
ncbi:L-lactate dehydrogenase 2 [Halomicronema hongdechloris C2206]|uniref:L-lactate dehydrogenase 2 n=1 Tax=Halomicronema hongdechloris C2206 TaxID=1641165 RepID=A0A1Z3HHA2_9CYAN|nr:malate dehydrogenase [Halomicronema hongdechloris]ASC69587.1 L-lactate dehydrogenase 2 [Halomicronema hongdechloris C2206]